MKPMNPPVQTSDTGGVAHIPIAPVPASRARVSKKGWAYFAGPYKKFREEVGDWVGGVTPWFLEGGLFVHVTFVCRAPKNPANPYPVGDIDNYIKAVWDALQGHWGFQDDKQVTLVHAIKRYQTAEEEPHILIRVRKDHGDKPT